MTIPQIDEIIHSRRKTIAIIVRRDGKVIVRAPLRASCRAILVFVTEKSGWIKEQLEKIRQNPVPAPLWHFEEGEKFWFLGQEYPLHFVPGQKKDFIFDNGFLIGTATRIPPKALFERFYLREARKILNERSASYARAHGFSYRRINITSARTRWGSCSTRGSVSFTWRLIMAPLAVVDYVILHELAHTQIPNHSRHFWDRMGQLLPDYRSHRQWLKENGNLLRLE